MLWGRLSHAWTQPSAPPPYLFRARSISRSLGFDNGIIARASLALSVAKRKEFQIHSRKTETEGFLQKNVPIEKNKTDAITCLDEVSLCEALRVVAILRSEEQTNGADLHQENVPTQHCLN